MIKLHFSTFRSGTNKVGYRSGEHIDVVVWRFTPCGLVGRYQVKLRHCVFLQIRPIRVCMCVCGWSVTSRNYTLIVANILVCVFMRVGLCGQRGMTKYFRKNQCTPVRGGRFFSITAGHTHTSLQSRWDRKWQFEWLQRKMIAVDRTEQSSWETASRWASEGFHRLLWTLTGHCCVHRTVYRFLSLAALIHSKKHIFSLILFFQFCIILASDIFGSGFGLKFYI